MNTGLKVPNLKAYQASLTPLSLFSFVCFYCYLVFILYFLGFDASLVNLACLIHLTDMTEKQLVGKITHYFSNIGVAIVELSAPVKKGDKISVEHESQSFEQIVESMQIEHKEVAEAKKGDAIGLKINERVTEGAKVYKINE